MPINRRAVLIATGAMLLSRNLHAADEQHALFWTVTPPGRKGAVLFGYERVAPDLTADVVRDGNALVDACERVVFDMPQAVNFGTVGVSNNQTMPIVQSVSPQTADRLRKILAATPFAPVIDKMGGIAATSLLMFEGQHKAAFTVGGAIVDHARAAGKPIDVLLTEPEVQSAFRPPDMVALNNAIGDETIAYMLDLRDRVGPIGGYLEQLYRDRRGEEIERFTSEMNRHGVFSMSKLMQTDQLRSLMFERALAMLTQQSDEARFMLFPLGILTGSAGVLAAFKAKGASVEPRA